jgi:hypothetical protein
MGSHGVGRRRSYAKVNSSSAGGSISVHLLSSGTRESGRTSRQAALYGAQQMSRGVGVRTSLTGRGRMTIAQVRV